MSGKDLSKKVDYSRLVQAMATREKEEEVNEEREDPGDN